MSMRRPSRPTSFTPSHGSVSMRRSRKKATSARWRPGSASVPTPPGLRWTLQASRATRISWAAWIWSLRRVAASATSRWIRPFSAQAKGNSSPGFLNERLMNDLRPTLFLAQLSNLLAGNIAIVHGVCGTSRTFMGEEVAGVDAARIALARIAAGQSDIALIGGSHNGERKDLLVLYEFGDFNLKGKFASVWSRHEHAGFALGSAGAFLVIESKEHAMARGAKPFARLSNVVADLSPRRRLGDVTA